MAELFQSKPNIQKFNEAERTSGGLKVNFRNIVLHPDIIPRESERWGHLTIAERKTLMRGLSDEKKLDRTLLAQALRSYRHDFPKEERQPLSAWIDSFRQNYATSKKADYHFIVGYQGAKTNPNLVAYSTLQVSRPREDLKTPVALSEYVVVKPAYRGKGIFNALWNRRIAIARDAGAHYMVGEKERYDSKEHARWLQLRSVPRSVLSSGQKERLDYLDAVRRRIRIFGNKYRYLKVPYVDPSEHVSFPGEGAGKLNRKGRLNPLWLFVTPLQEPGKTQVTRAEALSILRGLYQGPQDISRSASDFIVRQLRRKMGGGDQRTRRWREGIVQLVRPTDMIRAARFRRLEQSFRGYSKAA